MYGNVKHEIMEILQEKIDYVIAHINDRPRTKVARHVGISMSSLYRIVREHGDSDIIDIEIKQTKEDMEENKLNLKPFDIQKAREGKPVCTRDGRKARIICFDRISAKPILALVSSTDRKGEDVFDYFVSGKVIASPLESNLDLMMLPEKKEGWINIYNSDTTFYYVDGRVFETKDEAVQEAKEEVEKEQREKNEYIDTIRVEWEE